MKKFLATVFALSLFAGVFAQEEAIKGEWYNTEKTSKIKIFKATNGKYYGKIVWLEEPEKKDIHNPDASKHSDPLMGLLLLKDFAYDATKKQWTGGTIYDPGNGKTYDCFIWFTEGVDNVLNVKGFVMGMKFAGRQVEWTRTE
ncbi:MAG: DUF2147 domain-containing protein [Bacteroidota bacterium]|nr:MAG: DUF2147 domain-containing protein [Bacteroidota bacterium]